MIKNKPIAVFLLLFLLAVTNTQAQNIHQSVSASGGNATGSGGNVSYSVGQVVYTKNTGSNGSVAEGVQQPYEISVITETENAKGISLAISVFPNPTNDLLTLTVGNVDQHLSFQLYDIAGKILKESNITQPEVKISMLDLPSTTYFIRIKNNQKELKIFKIIKN